jgi:hypothetical protein
MHRLSAGPTRLLFNKDFYSFEMHVPFFHLGRTLYEKPTCHSARVISKKLRLKSSRALSRNKAGHAMFLREACGLCIEKAI